MCWNGITEGSRQTKLNQSLNVCQTKNMVHCICTVPGSANDLQPFTVLSTESVGPQGQSQMKLAAPSLLNDYCKTSNRQKSIVSTSTWLVGYGQTEKKKHIKIINDHLTDSVVSLFISVSFLSDTHLLDCSCNGMIALALGSSVFLWSSQSRALVGCLAPKLQPGRAYTHGQTILSLCWSSDGRALCIGNRRGDVEVIRL